ncbi:Histidine phosphatase superfamily, clade-1 [Ascosphaera apis ARSEF 7405]|uniref:Histidine phosphatase superfamily, clade-1 n=1 Tax=Ascosphaera apis ARSEF 7405 TaxID=392613 RepID=A0A168AME0_9EURO|nr:Histidine phosphatase superfamily, clade-1 [Ascosphaera apis ARSEF 7405]
MPLEHIYITRHANRMNWTVDHTTGQYYAQFPTPTGIAVDPVLTASGEKQAVELGEYLNSDAFPGLRPFRIYCSAFYRCLQTIEPGVKALKERQAREKLPGVDLDVRLERGLGEWFGASSFFKHPSPASNEELQELFPEILPAKGSNPSRPHEVFPSSSGESISQLHDRVAIALQSIIDEVDAEIAEFEAAHPEERKPRSILICSHAAPIIGMCRALTGDMPSDTSKEDFIPYVTCMFEFKRRQGEARSKVAETDKIVSERKVPDWRNGKGVGGGWDCIANADTSFLSKGAERGWHFSGEEDFLSMPPPQDISDSKTKL